MALKRGNFFAELKRRKVYRVAVAYAVVAWLLAQITTQVFPFFEIPNWAVRLVICLLALGFPVALLLSWAFDLTPQGIKRTEDIADDGSLASATGRSVPYPTRLSGPQPFAPEKSIAVLPFENLSDDRENTYFADGVHEDILTSLARIADLKVISRTSVQQYKTGVRNLREIARALGVAHILEGTVRRFGNRVRVNAQLINAQTDAHVWGDSFDRDLTDLFAIQSELAEQITNALRARLSPQEKAQLQMRPTSDLEAYDLYTRARTFFQWSGIGDAQENGQKALPLLQQAIERDSNFALAYCLASRIHAEFYWFGHDKRPARLAQARTAAETALQLQPDLGDVHLALGFYHYYAGRDYDRARREFALASGATPNDSEVPGGIGVIDRRQGRWEEAIANLERARQLDPRNVAAIWNLLETYSYLGRYPEAEHAIKDGLEISPDAHFFSLARAALSLRRNGETDGMRAALREVPATFDPGGAVSTIAIRISLMRKDYDEAEHRLLNSRRERFNDNGLSGVAGALDGYTVPRSWYHGLIAKGRGDTTAAHDFFTTALDAVEADVRQWPHEAKSISMLGLVKSALGRGEDALRDGRRAAEMLPVSKDALDGVILATNLAAIFAQAGERSAALDLLKFLVTQPGGPTAGLLRAEPEWDALREEGRFRALTGV